MSTGLLALLDDVAGIAKIAAASLDDTAAQAARAGVKAAGVVIDDAAVAPTFVQGFTASRELPIVGKIALGSVRNKLLYLTPAALVLSAVAPWAITPLLMLGGTYLCYEGAEKVYGAVCPHGAGHGHEGEVEIVQPDAHSIEGAKIRSGIQTDLILSAEIMAITLGSVPDADTFVQIAVLVSVGLGITALVYGSVAIIVKADDVGLSLAANERPAATLLGLLRKREGAPSIADRLLGPATRVIGRGLVRGMPVFLRVLSAVGTAAMVWVGGGIVIHGFELHGLPSFAHVVHGATENAAHVAPAASGFVGWLASAAGSGMFGLALGATLIALSRSVRFAWRRFAGA